jgi:hypothetical protein
MNITFESPDYNLLSLEKIVIIKLMNDFPDLTYADYSTKLGISERNLYRKLIAFGLGKRKATITKAEERAIKTLAKKGYIISKSEDNG